MTTVRDLVDINWAALRNGVAEHASDHGFFESHGISEEVWRSRPYERWATTNRDPIRAAYSGLTTARTMVSWSGQSDGWIIHRHCPPGLGLPRIYPEIRPDVPIKTEPPTRHYHGDPKSTPSPDVLHPRHVYSPGVVTRGGHVARAKFVDDHRGVNSDDVHEHIGLAKYVFPPTPRIDKPWRHDHDAQYPSQEKRAVHIASRHHNGEDLVGSHQHVSRAKERSLALAARIDVHPLAVPMFATAPYIFFAIEGCLKADAILSCGQAVCSVPSVTLWDCAELSAFTNHYLRGSVVVIVPDSDWEEIGAVVTQARLLQTRLLREGVVAKIAAPPKSTPGRDGKSKKVGVDDFLVAGGGLGDLDIIDRERSAHLRQFAMSTGRRTDKSRRTYDVLWALSMHANVHGAIQMSLRSLARVMGMPVMRVSRGLRDLEQLGAITIDGDLKVQRGRFVGQGQYIRQLDWEDTPIFTIREDLRAVDGSTRTLESFQATPKAYGRK